MMNDALSQNYNTGISLSSQNVQYNVVLNDDGHSRHLKGKWRTFDELDSSNLKPDSLRDLLFV